MPQPSHDYIALSNGQNGSATGASPTRHRSSCSALVERIQRRRGLILIALVVVVLISAFERYTPSSQGPERSAWPVDIHPQENEYFKTGKIWDHNDEVSAKLERCASLGILRNTSLPLPPLSDDEEANLISQGCGTNETTVLILADEWFVSAYEARRMTGETIYAQSVISTLNAYGYSYMFASLGWFNYDLARIMDIWQKHRWNIRLVLGERNHVKNCWENKGRKCLRTREFPEGIDPWRLMSFWYWDDSVNPLDHQWTLSASHLNENFFLGYSIEPTCRRLPYIPQSQRSDPPQAYILSKRGNYLKAGPEFAWDLPFLASMQEALGISAVAGFSEEDETSALFPGLGMKDMGKLGQIQFYEMLAMSFVMIGVGRPRVSPSPWDALCMGTPFINPIVAWDETDPSNRSSWHPQQWRMIDLHPPYVYHVHAHDLPALQAAVAAARNTPIESFIPPHMKFEHVCERTAVMVERDWRGLALEILEDRRATGEGPLFDIF